jgi:hypothetical protein
MKVARGVLFVVAVLALAATCFSQSKAQAAFDRLKTIVGEWEGSTGAGQRATLTYRVVSGGSVLEETLKPDAEDAMITVYHLDGDRLMVTHYCGAGNQPRMVGTPDPNNPNVFAFKFLDVTNLSPAQPGHMRDLVLTIVDKDHLTQQWTWKEKDKEAQMEVFKFARKK